jgi:hypothetical protein
VIDDRFVPNQTAAMKYLPHLLLATVTAFSLASCAAPGGGGASGGAETQLGPHSAQKFVLATHTGARQLNTADRSYVEKMALVVKVEQKMVGGQQEITASASTHRDGPTGEVLGMPNLRVHVTQPVDFSTEPRKAGEVHIAKSIPASGGKFNTVAAEASFDSPDYNNAMVSITVPGDQ